MYDDYTRTIRPYRSSIPTQRGNVKISNLDRLNAFLYVAEHGCKWRGLPPRFGKWYTIYKRMNRTFARWEAIHSSPRVESPDRIALTRTRCGEWSWGTTLSPRQYRPTLARSRVTMSAVSGHLATV